MDPLTETLRIRVTKADKVAIAAEAERSNMPISMWVRHRLLNYVKFREKTDERTKRK